MGSLMAGWDSPVLDSPRGTLERNKSLTKEEIENYWRMKRRTEEEHRMAALDLSQSSDGGNKIVGERAVAERPTYLERSKTFPGLESRFPSDEQARKLNAWWTRSNWAFLNEPPLREMEGPAYKYSAQYHIAAPTSRDGVASTS